MGRGGASETIPCAEIYLAIAAGAKFLNMIYRLDKTAEEVVKVINTITMVYFKKTVCTFIIISPLILVKGRLN